MLVFFGVVVLALDTGVQGWHGLHVVLVLLEAMSR